MWNPPLDGSSGCGNKSGLFKIASAVVNSGCFSKVAGRTHQPSPKPVIGALLIE